jgi:hypothetical protein
LIFEGPGILRDDRDDDATDNTAMSIPGSVLAQDCGPRGDERREKVGRLINVAGISLPVAALR